MWAFCAAARHIPVHCTFINLMKLPNIETLIFLVSASNHFMF